jgi:hypothetical protein
VRDEDEMAFRVGEAVGKFEFFHCAACEGTVTVAIVVGFVVVFVFWFCNAIFRRLARLAVWDNCALELAVTVV